MNALPATLNREHDQAATDRAGRELLDFLNGAAAVAITPVGDGYHFVASAWNGSATVNTVGLRLTPGGLAVTGFDVWTSYELHGLTAGEVVGMMDAVAREEVAA